MNRVRALVLGLVLVMVTGCGLLPDSGAVHRQADAPGTTSQEVPYFSPPGPDPGDSPSAVATGFLTAMQANPLSTVAARTYLTPQAAEAWKPAQGTIIYQVSTVQRAARTASSAKAAKAAKSSQRVVAGLSDAVRLDARGGWLGGTPGRAAVLDLLLVKVHKEWRISNPPDALAVPASYFQSRFVPFFLYFYDQTGRVLVPDRVYVPRGEQTASNLVRALVHGPGSALKDVVRSGFPVNTDLDLSVLVTDSGIAEVPLSAGMLHLSTAELQRAIIQLAWTLRQVPGITRVRITVDGAPVPLAGGQIDASVDEGPQFDPLGNGVAGDQIAIRGGRVVTLAGSGAVPVSGPFGRPGRVLRSLALSEDGLWVTAVSGNGRTAYVGPKQGTAALSRVRQPVTGAADLLRPSYDMFGDVWLVDRSPFGARVHVVRAGRDRVVDVPGITGRRVSAAVISRDGTRLVAALASGANPRLVVAAIIRTGSGVVRSASTGRVIGVQDADLGPALDVAWTSPTTLAVIARRPGRPSRLVYIEADGSPGDGTPTPTEGFPARAASLVATPSQGSPVEVLTSDTRLYSLSPSGRWAPAAFRAPVVAAAYAN
ncbi:MAG: LpqB family beta-propeller domain-containing protein [Actinomycetota bacterium]|nr:LpqB family beta-propeller domain-containing protein [Actinomycetota bacterium]